MDIVKQDTAEKESEFIKIFEYEHKESDYAISHGHNSFEFNFYLSGEGEISIGDVNCQYKGKSCMLICPNIIHDEFCKTDTEVICLQFLSDLPFHTMYFEMNAENESLILNIEKSVKQIIQRRNQNIELYKSDRAEFAKTIRRDFDIFIIDLMRLNNFNSDSKITYKERVIKYVKAEIKNNLDSRINFDIIAEKLGYSSDRLRRIFKEETSETVYQYTLNKRLSKAKELLKETTLPIKQIATECGFNSEIRFDRFFKQKLDMSPRQYRKIFVEIPQDKVYRK